MVKKKSQVNVPVLVIVVVIITIAFLLGGVWMNNFVHPKLSVNVSSNRSITDRDGAEVYLGERYPSENFMIEALEDTNYHSSTCEGEISGLARWKVSDNHGVSFELYEKVSPEQYIGRYCNVDIAPIDNYKEEVARKVVALSNEELSINGLGYLVFADEENIDKYELADKILAYYAGLKESGFINEVMPVFEIENNYSSSHIVVDSKDERADVLDKISKARD